MAYDLVTSRAMSIIVHGDSKAGKTSLGATTPAPRLLLDAEAAHRFLPGNKITWDPITQEPPKNDGTWETCVVVVRSFQHMTRAYEWLNSGQHPFKSVVVDSITEIQTKLKEDVSGGVDTKFTFDLWGQVLAKMEDLLRKIRDLTEHPTNPIQAIVITAMTSFRDGKWRPFLQGQSATKLPYFFDVIGYMYVDLVYDQMDPTQPPKEVRRMLTGFDPNIIAGERVQGRLPRIIDNPNVTDMLDTVFGPAPAETPNTKVTK